MTSVLARLTRTLGGVWPNREQALILQAIFAPPDQALVAFEAWQADLAIEQPFDPSVMRLLPLLYLRLLDLRAETPLMGRLKGVYRRVWSDTHALFYGTAPALAALHGAGIATLLLKGAPMVLGHYRNFGSRPMADLDIAVPLAQVEAAFAALARAGWTAESLARDDLLFRHATTFRSAEGQEIDLHWHLLFEARDAQADALFWANTQALDFRGIPTQALSPTLSLFHTLAHGMRPNVETPIRWIADALTLLRDPGVSLDWNLLCNTAIAHRLNHRVLHALRFLQATFGQPIPAEACRALGAVRRSVPEVLELAVMAPAWNWPRPALVARLLLLTAEYCRLPRHHSRLALLPRFMRYRLGLRRWPNPVRWGKRKFLRVVG